MSKTTFAFYFTGLYFEVTISGEAYCPAHTSGPPESCYEACGGDWDWEACKICIATPHGLVERDIPHEEAKALGLTDTLGEMVNKRLTAMGFYG